MNENDAMELSDLKEAWAVLDRRVDADVARLRAITAELAGDRARTLVRRALRAPLLELLTVAALAVPVVHGLLHVDGALFAACSVATLVLFAALAASDAWQIAAVATLDATAPVVETQRRLGRVAAHRVLVTRWVLLLSPVLWTPFLVVGVGLLVHFASGGSSAGGGVFGAGFALANLLVGAVLSAALWWGSRRLADRLRGSPFVQRVLDDMAGRSLVAARRFLSRLEGFERE